MKNVSFKLNPEDNDRLNQLCGQLDENLHLIEEYMAVEVNHRGHNFKIVGPAGEVDHAKEFIENVYQDTDQANPSTEEINVKLQGFINTKRKPNNESFDENVLLTTTKKDIRPRGLNQLRYIKRIQSHDINFGIGPAGTGKTFLAVAVAVAALEQGEVKRLVLVRPAVEAGENLGFLPGDLAQKVDPYLRPMYDALYELMGIEKVTKLIAQQVIEIAPLAFMRGRNLNDSFIILDESQNTTLEQMKMFLTRMGFNSSAIITGDITQVDLPKGKPSGLRNAIDVLADIDNISFTFFDNQDVVRHPVVQSVVEAYDKYNNDLTTENLKNANKR